MGVFHYFIVRVQLDTVKIRPFIHQSIADSFFFLIYPQKNSHSHNSNTDGEGCPHFYNVSAVVISTFNKIVFFGIYHAIL